MRLSGEKTGGNWLPERGRRKCLKNQRFRKKTAKLPTQTWPTSKFCPALILVRSYGKGEKTQDP